METIQEPITGKEKFGVAHLDVNEKIYKALNEFYMAFNSQNFDLMQKNWMNSKDIAMSNPLGGIKRGWDDIKVVYQRIFKAKVVVYVEFYDYVILEMKDGFCAVGRERGYVDTAGDKLNLEIRTSRIFVMKNGEYKQVHHHGSIENYELLKQYQNLLK